MKLRESLPQSQVYESRFSTVETYSYNKSLENLYSSVKEAKHEEKRRLREAEKSWRKEVEAYEGKNVRILSSIWAYTFGQFNEDWIFLAILGIMVAIISYILDKGVMMCGRAQMWLYELASQGFATYVAWICLPICLIIFDVGFVHLVAPQAAGSGLPQIKTILRGVFLKEVLTFRCLIAKWVGITSTLGSGMPLGKEGPLIHMSCIIVTKMSRMIRSFHGIYENKWKTMEMLGAAWAVGVACTFNSPIGGVLFSIEISTAYYAVRNYWRGFFAALWGATTYRLLSVWIDGMDTIGAVFKTSFFVDFPYDPQELIAFAIVGVICGFAGSLYICCKQIFDKWLKTSGIIKQIKQTSVFLYPALVVWMISTVTYPPGIGQFIASDITPKDQVLNLFSNFTWTHENLTVSQNEVLNHWTNKYAGIYVNLVCFIFYQCLSSIISSTMPVPNGCFIPTFRSGAALGRIIGELMHTWFPYGVRYNGKITPIMPGAYAMVGASAFGGAVTHTMSTCVILFEMTSQISHVIPVLISTLIANGIAKMLTPSIYDLIIRANKLPYLPDLLPNKSAIYTVYVEDFMIRDVKFINLGITYKQLKLTLKENKSLKNFPLVDSPHNMILLGSISRRELINLLEKHIGRERRLEIIPNLDEKGEPIEIDEQTLRRRTSLAERERIFNRYQVDNKKKKVVTKPKRVYMPITRIIDLSPEDQAAWEEEQLAMEADFSKCRIDPAPFQLVERTSLLKVHSLFFMLAVNLAYVTSIGKLVGVVGLTELRKAIEDANQGITQSNIKLPPLPQHLETIQETDVDKPLMS